ncbi:hypothetical protein CC86DRAFT_211978 [Ophiobolus disseminans]|uniref:Nephrocystin 3-like N-terminal domain-containing protein n=1 Tax=Ophiobolus disseminans TaxID=1469910 RepID=A0A6A7A2Y8_9PLEO|nr:hypothetical protein CC86DRAFT_211978 [Ophiobolus disseminans]
MHWVLQSTRFKHWIQSNNSDVLLVIGNLEDGMARIPAMSFLCSMLVGSLRHQRNVYVLHSFCGTRNSRSHPESGLRGMIRSLTSQLLSMHEFDTGSMNVGRWKAGIRSNSSSTLGRLFGRLIEQLPDVVVFCVIDGISLFEMEPWNVELQPIVETLLEAVASREASARVKLLFACTTMSIYLSCRLAERNRLSIPTDAGNSRLLTSRTAHFELTKNNQLLYEEETNCSGTSRYRPSLVDVYEHGFE